MEGCDLKCLGDLVTKSDTTLERKAFFANAMIADVQKGEVVSPEMLHKLEGELGKSGALDLQLLHFFAITQKSHELKQETISYIEGKLLTSEDKDLLLLSSIIFAIHASQYSTKLSLSSVEQMIKFLNDDTMHDMARSQFVIALIKQLSLQEIPDETLDKIAIAANTCKMNVVQEKLKEYCEVLSKKISEIKLRSAGFATIEAALKNENELEAALNVLKEISITEPQALSSSILERLSEVTKNISYSFEIRLDAIVILLKDVQTNSKTKEFSESFFENLTTALKNSEGELERSLTVLFVYLSENHQLSSKILEYFEQSLNTKYEDASEQNLSTIEFILQIFGLQTLIPLSDDFQTF